MNIQYKTLPTFIDRIIVMARPEGFEPPIFRIGICCVIQLRHERLYRRRFAAFCYLLMARSSQMRPMSMAA